MQVDEITVDFGPIGVGQRRFAELRIVNESPFAAECLLSSAGKISKSGAVSVCRRTAPYPLYPRCYIHPCARCGCGMSTADGVSRIPRSSTQYLSLLDVF
jgi:hypothetical protein